MLMDFTLNFTPTPAFFVGFMLATATLVSWTSSDLVSFPHLASRCFKPVISSITLTFLQSWVASPALHPRRRLTQGHQGAPTPPPQEGGTVQRGACGENRSRMLRLPGFHEDIRQHEDIRVPRGLRSRASLSAVSKVGHKMSPRV